MEGNSGGRIMGEILITADILPTNSNINLFEEGKTEELFGSKIISLFNGSDYRIVNLEGPLTDAAEEIDKDGPCLKGSTKSFNGLRSLNIDVFSIANNHIMDYGEEGLNSTVQILKKSGAKYCGAGQNLEEARKPHIFTCDQKKIGLLSCTEYEFTIATQTRPGANPFEPMNMIDDIIELKQKVDYMIILYHGGKEYYRYPVPYVQRRCRKMIEKGANLIICQHSHCIGCYEQYQEGTIIYGQGNFLFDRGSDEFRNSGLIITCDPIVNKIKFYPVVREENVVRMADEEQTANIMKEFYNRTEEIKKKNFVEEQYSEFAMKMFDIYRYRTLGRIGRFIEKFHLNFLINMLFTKKHDMWIINSLRCEAHRDLYLCGLLKKYDLWK